MTDDLPPVRCDDESTWRHKDEKIDLPRLLELIEENGGPEGLDLHGCDMCGIDARPEAVRPRVEAYGRALGARAKPPWAGFGDTISLHAAHLEGAALVRAHLEDTGLIDAHLERANLTQAHLEGAALTLAHLEDARLWFASLQGADLGEAELQNATLTGAHLENASLQGAHLENAALRHAHLENADLRDAHLRGAFWYACYLDRTRIRRDSLGRAIGDELEAHKEKGPGNYRDASEAYLLLKNNFSSTGRYEDASWAYVKEQQMEKMAYYREWRSCGWKIWSAWGSLWRWLRNWLYEAITGYGENPWRPLIIGALSILAFAFGYFASGGVAGFIDALIYSLATFATFNLARPEVQPQGTGMEMASSFEALLGIGTLALFVYTVGNRLSRS